MVGTWKVQLINPSNAVEVALRDGWAKALKDLEKWIEKELVPAMIYGGLGIVGIADTPFYRFISSPDGLGQLGIDSSEPPRLLEAYRKAFTVGSNNNTLLLMFGDLATLKLLTPHPASGTGRLHVQSWLEWIVDDLPVTDAGYVERSNLPSKLHKSIRVRSAPGGLMLPRGAFGSAGVWRFPAQLHNYDVDWLNGSLADIERVITNQLLAFLVTRLS